MTLDDKIDRLVEMVGELRVSLAKYEAILERNTDDIARHIKRTDLLEERVEQVALPIRSIKWMVGAIGSAYGAIKIYMIFH